MAKTARLVRQGLNDSIVSRVDSEIAMPEKSISLALEDIGNPAKGIIEIPDSDADAAADLDASADSLEVPPLVDGAPKGNGRR